MAPLTSAEWPGDENFFGKLFSKHPVGIFGNCLVDAIVCCSYVSWGHLYNVLRQSHGFPSGQGYIALLSKDYIKIIPWHCYVFNVWYYNICTEWQHYIGTQWWYLLRQYSLHFLHMFSKDLDTVLSVTCIFKENFHFVSYRGSLI